MRKMFASMFLFCMCALAFVASAEVVNDQSCYSDVVLVDSLHVAPASAAESIGVGTEHAEGHEKYRELSLTVEMQSDELSADAPERYDKIISFNL